MVLTMVGAKKASPWTVMLLSKKTAAVERVMGLRIPRRSFFLSILSNTCVWPTRSDLTRAMAMSFSAWVSQRAVSGRSVRVTKNKKVKISKMFSKIRSNLPGVVVLTE